MRLASLIRSTFGSAAVSTILCSSLHNLQNILFYCLNNKLLLNLCSFFKYSSFFRTQNFIDIVSIDHLGKSLRSRFSLIYILQSLDFFFRIHIRIFGNEHTSFMSITSLFPGALWYERQAWDMFGLFFSNNPDLRRILTDYGFQGFPLRKDFPLTGFLEVRYDDSCEFLVYEPVELMQEFRNFDLVNPWEVVC